VVRRDAFAQQVKGVAGVSAADAPSTIAVKLRAAIDELLTGENSAQEVASHIAIMLGIQAGSKGADETVADRSVLFGSARRLVQAIANAAPTVLVFQDLHWADSSLLDLVKMLSTSISEAPLVLLTAARPELRTKRPQYGADTPTATTPELEPLGLEHSCELAEQLLARAERAEFARKAGEIAETGEGNPLFIEELAASVAERSAPTGSALPRASAGSSQPDWTRSRQPSDPSSSAHRSWDGRSGAAPSNA
jgi:predicted ATPase